MEEPTLYDAVQAFDSLAQAVAFTSNEYALTFALFRTWNAARRPAVIEQWGNTTCQNSGLTGDTLPGVRNKLAQKGVIFFQKNGNRGVPRYSLNALFEKDNPFLLRENPSNPQSNPPSKCRVTHRVSDDSYQGKEKEKNKNKESASPPCVTDCTEQAKQMFPNINTSWLESTARSFHSHFTMEDWQLRNGTNLLPNKWKQRLRTWVEEKARREKPQTKGKEPINYVKSL